MSDNNDTVMDILHENSEELNTITHENENQLPEHSILDNIPEKNFVAENVLRGAETLVHISMETDSNALTQAETSNEVLTNSAADVTEVETPDQILTEMTPDVTETESSNQIMSENASVIEGTLESKSKQSSRLPLSRIKQIMKFDSDCSLISREALLLISEATVSCIFTLKKKFH